MLTVIVCFDGSGKSSTRRPLSSRYSVMPSTVVTLTGEAGPDAAAAVGAGGGGIGWSFRAWVTGAANTATDRKAMRIERRLAGDIACSLSGPRDSIGPRRREPSKRSVVPVYL